MSKNYFEYLKESKKFNAIVSKLKETSFFGFEGVSIYDVGKYYKKAVWEGTLSTRSASLAFNFFLAIFPTILFLLSLIPYIPLEGLYDKLIQNIIEVFPQGVNEPIINTIKDLVDHEREGFLVFNILLALYFSSNGVVNMMTQFNNTNLFQEKRVWWKKRLVAIFLVLFLTTLVLTAVLLVTFTKDVIIYFFAEYLTLDLLNWTYINIVRWIIIVVLFYVAISSLYYFGPAKRKHWKFFSAGSTTATILVILASLGFSYYVNHFSNYNAIYGSIGTIIIIMLYFQLNSFVLLLGFELNASIRRGRFDMKESKVTK